MILIAAPPSLPPSPPLRSPHGATPPSIPNFPMHPQPDDTPANARTRPTVPPQLRTERLLLRRWRPEDAIALAPVLEANVDRLRAWIPWRVARPAAAPELAERLAGFAVAFEDDTEWRYGIFSPDEQLVLGEASLFPRSEAGRVPLASADRVEIGYWLREEATGQGLATEASRALRELARTLRAVHRVEIWCDALNDRSSAVPRRLDFRLAATIEEAPASPDEPPAQLQVWAYELGPSETAGARASR